MCRNCFKCLALFAILSSFTAFAEINSPDGRLTVEINPEAGNQIAMVREVRNRGLIHTFGHPSKRFKMSLEELQALYDKKLWLDVEGLSVTSTEWRPTFEAQLAVAFGNGQVVVMDFPVLFTFPEFAEVNLTAQLRHAPRAGMRLPLLYRLDRTQYILGWSPDGRYLAVMQDGTPYLTFTIYDFLDSKAVHRETIRLPGGKRQEYQKPGLSYISPQWIDSETFTVMSKNNDYLFIWSTDLRRKNSWCAFLLH